MVTFDIQTKELQRLVQITLDNDMVRVESGAMHYTIGNIAVEANMPSLGGLFKSILTSENIVRPVYKGTGKLFLEPSFGEFTVLELTGEEWILDKGAYYASEMSVEVGMFTNKAISGLASGEGFFQTKVAGRGKVIVFSLGPLEMIELNNEKLVVDGPYAVARTGNLDFKVEMATKGMFGSMVSGEGLVNTFTGTGRVLIAPVPHRDAFLASQFELLQSSIASIRTK